MQITEQQQLEVANFSERMTDAAANTPSAVSASLTVSAEAANSDSALSKPAGDSDLKAFVEPDRADGALPSSDNASNSSSHVVEIAQSAASATSTSNSSGSGDRKLDAAPATGSDAAPSVNIPSFKVLVVGDGAVGKTVFIERHKSGNFEYKYIGELPFRRSKLSV